jgi:hypothetical protein
MKSPVRRTALNARQYRSNLTSWTRFETSPRQRCWFNAL